ncbi:MauE/DoxX family redox-associated membrane protein [Dasania marina]|uniref:MauE/DoxX family redox-associated membrane protein n=1 Tax=Dasania marina TaxID=471499 RepID=UPI0030DBA5E6|tara:strand:+ start:55663 stop:56199 length:537 start_codon:yes stop_codon:yes gene_type:complete
MELTWVLANAAALFLLWLFVAAGSSKLQRSNGNYYAVVFTGYGIPPGFWAQQLPKMVGLVEVIVGMMVVVPALRQWGAIAAAAILASYFLLVAWQLMQGKTGMDCGCAGPDDEIKISGHLLIRNLLLLALALFCLLSVGSSGVMPWVMSVLAASIMVLLYLSCEQLMVTAQRIKLLYR